MYGRMRQKTLLMYTPPSPGTSRLGSLTQDKGKRVLAWWLLWVAGRLCLRLLEQVVRLAASRTFCTAGSSRPIRTAMMAITTSNSISVKPSRGRSWRRHDGNITDLQKKNNGSAG